VYTDRVATEFTNTVQSVFRDVSVFPEESLAKIEFKQFDFCPEMHQCIRTRLFRANNTLEISKRKNEMTSGRYHKNDSGQSE